MATAKSTTPTPAPERERDPEGELLRAFRRMAPPERAKALQLVLEEALQ